MLPGLKEFLGQSDLPDSVLMVAWDIVTALWLQMMSPRRPSSLLTTGNNPKTQGIVGREGHDIHTHTHTHLTVHFQVTDAAGETSVTLKRRHFLHPPQLKRLEDIQIPGEEEEEDQGVEQVVSVEEEK